MRLRQQMRWVIDVRPCPNGDMQQAAHEVGETRLKSSEARGADLHGFWIAAIEASLGTGESKSLCQISLYGVCTKTEFYARACARREINHRLIQPQGHRAPCKVPDRACEPWHKNTPLMRVHIPMSLSDAAFRFEETDHDQTSSYKASQ